MYTDLGGFLACALVILFAGQRLSYYGDLLAEVTGLGRAWIGLILMAAVTSLPELIVGIGSVSLIGSADLAVGDVLGSCAFNLGILSLMDIFTPRTHPLFSRVSKGNILAASFGAILVAMVGLIIYMKRDIPLARSFGLTSILLAATYFLALRSIYRYQKEIAPEAPESSDALPLSRAQIVLRYTAYAVVIIAAALALPHFADKIATATGLGKTFVGTLFLAASTSLPELAVSIAAIRLGAVDLAVGNLLGSNLFNIFILVLDDAFYRTGYLLQDVSPNHMISVFFVIIMTGVAIIGLIFPARQKRLLLSYDTLAIFFLYLGNITLLYLLQ